MKAMVIDQFGAADKLRLADLPKPSPKANEVLVEIAYTSVNPVDWKIAEGHLKDFIPHRLPLTLGWDASGTVVEVGSGVTQFKVGDKIYSYTRKSEVHDGTYAEFIALDASAVALMPRNLTFREAAAFPLVGLTAWQCLFDKAKLTAGQTCLVHGGAGGVGGLAIQFAKQAGAYVLTTASAKNHSYVSELGADTIVDYTKQNFASVIHDHFPQGIDVVVDTVGGSTLKESYTLLKKGGHLVSIVEPPDEIKAKSIGISASHHFVEPNGKQLAEIAKLVESKEVLPLDIEEMPLENAAEAITKNKTRHQRGKIVLRIK